MTFQEEIRQGIPKELPQKKPIDDSVDHAPKRPVILSLEEKKLAVRNALRYFPIDWHAELAKEFYEELHEYGRIYMYRFKPLYQMHARPLAEYPSKCASAAAIMLMIQNNLDPAVAQFPHELITYGGNGAVFQNWAQYLLTMQYLSQMTEEQTLHMYSGHPMGLFPSSKRSPRVVVTNGMMIPNHSSTEDYDRYNSLGVTQYGQMTAGSYMYIGPQGIVHGTTITLMNAFRKVGVVPEGHLFVTSGLGGMSGAQPKAGNIVGCTSVCAEVNPHAARKRHQQGWVDELVEDMDELVHAVRHSISSCQNKSFAFIGNVVDVWEAFYQEDIKVSIGSDQTSLHNPWGGGYYPAALSFEESREMMRDDPEAFKKAVQASLIRHAKAINQHTARGMYFFDYGNAFLLEASRAGAPIMNDSGTDFRYRSYVQDILGPMCFDYGFGPFRWVCSSGNADDLAETDRIATIVLERLMKEAPAEIRQQMQDNVHWIREAADHHLVVGSEARILYADAQGRISIAKAFNDAIKSGRISAPVILGRDHHDVSGTDSPYRETSNIYDGSAFTADMSIHNVIGDSFRGATWVSIHNGGGVGWGEVSNGGFGMVLEGDDDSEARLKEMLFFDVNNGIARRGWARNEGALAAIKREMKRTKGLSVTLPSLVDDEILDRLV